MMLVTDFQSARTDILNRRAYVIDRQYHLWHKVIIANAFSFRDSQTVHSLPSTMHLWMATHGG